MNKMVFILGSFVLNCAASAQESSPPVQAVLAVPSQGMGTVLPANTEILLSMNEDLTTKGGKLEIGEKFTLSVVHDVMLGDYVVIPKGTGATGEVTWVTGKGVFGKSGKMDIELRYVDLSGRRIPVRGKYRQEGEGNTLAAIGAIFLTAPLLFVTGKSARIPQGRELRAITTEAIPVKMK